MRDRSHPWSLPVSGGALGRLGEDFLRDLDRDYRAHGAAAIAAVRKNEPRNYLRLMLSLAPKEPLEETNWLERLTDEQISGLLEAARAELAKFD